LKKVFEINNIQELQTVADELINQMKENKIFLFYGEMGSGKTTLIGELCKRIGINRYSSPTYGIINNYLSPNFGEIYHVDCYRLNEETEAISCGLMELMDENEFCFIEWPEKIQNLLPHKHVKVTLKVLNNIREITLTL
jgi:tRNA threonylcarbamoyladenosine biosynthesis protein TsaE